MRNADNLRGRLDKIANAVSAMPDDATLTEGILWWQTADGKARARCPSRDLFAWLEAAPSMQASPDDEPVPVAGAEPEAVPDISEPEEPPPPVAVVEVSAPAKDNALIREANRIISVSHNPSPRNGEE